MCANYIDIDKKLILTEINKSDRNKKKKGLHTQLDYHSPLSKQQNILYPKSVFFFFYTFTMLCDRTNERKR